MWRRQTSNWLPFIIILLALALHSHQLAADSFWGDEILTATFASRSPGEIISWTAGDIHPPLYYLLSGGFVYFTTSLATATSPAMVTDWLWRFPSVIATVLTIAVTYRLTLMAWAGPGYTLPTRRQLAGATILLLSLAPLVVKYSQEARMHALFMCLSVSATWLFFTALNHQPAAGKLSFGLRWLALGLVTAANLYTIYFGFLIVATQAMFLLGTLLRRRQPFSSMIGFSGAMALAGILYLPWWPVLGGLLQRRAAVGAIEGGVGSPSDFLAGVLLTLGPSPPPVAGLFAGLYIIGLIVLARRDGPLALLTGLWVILPALLPLLLGDPRARQFRYAFVLPIYLLVIVYGLWCVVEIGLSRLVSSTNRQAIWRYGIWLLATVSFIATLGIYHQRKPDWRAAAAYLTSHTTPADIILIGPLWDEGRFINYYYRGGAQRLTPAALVANIDAYAVTMRQQNGRLWAVNRFAPNETAFLDNHLFTGVVISEAQLTVYEPAILAEAALDLAAQAVDSAYPWAASSEAQGIINPDPRTARAAALKAWGDALVAAGRPAEALPAYQTAVDSFPGWVNGYLTLARTQEMVGNLAAAAQAYRQAVAYNPRWQNQQATVAASLVEAGHWAEAVALYQQIIEAK